MAVVVDEENCDIKPIPNDGAELLCRSLEAAVALEQDHPTEILALGLQLLLDQCDPLSVREHMAN